jgi:hypothetical protein
MNSKVILAALGIAFAAQVSSSDAHNSPLLVIPTACGPAASSSFVTAANTPQILLIVDATGSNAAAEISGVDGHPVTSLQFDTTAVFGLLGADPNLEVVALVHDSLGRNKFIVLDASIAAHQNLSGGYTRCTFSRTQLAGFHNVVRLWVNCANPNFTEFPPGENEIFVKSIVVDNLTATRFSMRSNNSACLISAQEN